MDYSLLLGIHNLDKETKTNPQKSKSLEEYYEEKLREQQNLNDSSIQQSGSISTDTNQYRNSTTLQQQQINEQKTYEMLFNV